MTAADLPARILAAIEADEVAARKMLARVAASPGSYISLGLDHPELAAGDCPGHLGEYDPARVLARCAADRDIVALHQPDHLEPDICSTCMSAVALWPCPTLRALAAGYGLESEEA